MHIGTNKLSDLTFTAENGQTRSVIAADGKIDKELNAVAVESDGRVRLQADNESWRLSQSGDFRAGLHAALDDFSKLLKDQKVPSQLEELSRRVEILEARSCVGRSVIFNPDNGKMSIAFE